eukprot:GGOE01015886.1.p1 GENE.GGOE01015886.1~~GGOE01015886.1.p1  ORF type:complete len:258 (-),score=15.36 GGOE01015886.1:490-1215(-)
MWQLVLLFCPLSTLRILRLSTSSMAQLIHDGKMLHISFGKALRLVKSRSFDWRCCDSFEGHLSHISVHYPLLLMPISSALRVSLACSTAVVMVVAQLHATRLVLPPTGCVVLTAALLPYYEVAYNAFWTAVRRRTLQDALKELHSRYTVVGQAPFISSTPQLVLVRACPAIPPSLLSICCVTATALMLQWNRSLLDEAGWNRVHLHLLTTTVLLFSLRRALTRLCRQRHWWQLGQCDIWST